MNEVARAPQDMMRKFHGRIVQEFACEQHGFAGLNVPGTIVCCRYCGRRILTSFVDLILADHGPIRPLMDGEELGDVQPPRNVAD